MKTSRKMKAKFKNKIIVPIFVNLLIFLLNPLFTIDVYFKEKEVKVGEEATLIINATNFSGKVRGVINFGNFIIKWDCVYLNNQIIEYKIIPSKTEGTVFFEFEDGKFFSKTFKIKENKNYTPLTTFIYYVEEKNCFFNPQNRINKDINEIEKKEYKLNKTKNNYTVDYAKTGEKKEKSLNIVLFFLFSVLILLFVAYYFYKLGKEESKIEEKLNNIYIPKLKQELIQIENESDYKKKAFLLYKLLSSDDYLKNKIGENKLQNLYYLSFKKELNENDKEFIESLIKEIKGV